MPKLFAKLCKNTIFPLTSSSSSSRSQSRSHTSNSNVYETSPRQNVNNNQQPEVLEENPNQREPPPPYWEHHNHRVLVQPRQQQNQELRRPPPPTPPSSPPAEHHQHLNNVQVRNNVQIQFNDTSDDDDDDDIYSNFEYNYTIRNNLNYSDDIFCPDLVRNCSIANDDNSSIEPDTNTADEELLLANLSRITINNEHNNNNNTKEDTNNNDNQVIQHQMGQNLSLRRPKISLTWVLREQNTNSHQHQQAQTSSKTNNNNISSSLKLEPTIKPSEIKKKKQSTTSSVEVPKYQSTQPIKNPMIVVAPAVALAAPPIQSNLANNKTNNNNNSSNNNNKLKNVLTLSELKLHAANQKLSSEPNEHLRTKLCENQSDIQSSSVYIKSTYSEPSLCTTVSGDTNNCINSNSNSNSSNGNVNNINNSNSNAHRHRHRQRKRKDRNRSQRFGYEIKNVDEFLSKCSLTTPANIPVVLSAASTLYQTRPGGHQIELPLPLGMVVNAVFKNQNWLYVQTPHAEEGYVNYSSCLPLGILPPIRSSPTSRPPPCWENSGDVFPRPCGNMTDSEKEQLRCDRGGTRSEGARTPKLRRNTKICSERNVDALYLRAASQPKLADKSNYAQLKPTNKLIKPSNYSMSEYGGSGGGGCNSEKSNDEYISLHQPKHRLSRTISNSTNLTLLRQNYYHTNHHHHHRHPHNNTTTQPNGLISKPMRQTLLAITENYCNSKIAVKKGDVVILISAKDFRIPTTNQIKQWFYVKTRENICGLIPAEVAGHGFL